MCSMARGKRSRKINYFEILPNNIIEKIIAHTVTGDDLKDIGNKKKKS